MDFLDECAGAERALTPRVGKERREALRIMAVATGAAEKGVTQIYETAFRPPEKRYRPWMERCHTQMHAALAELDRVAQARVSEWLIGDRMTQRTSPSPVFTPSSPMPWPSIATVWPIPDSPRWLHAVKRFGIRHVKAEWFPPGDPS